MMQNDKKPKLLHLTSSLKRGGAEQVLVDLVEALGSDYEHEVLFFYDGPHKDSLERLGVSCSHICGALCLYDPIFWWRLTRAIKRFDPDCIHSLLWGANWASRLLGPFFHVPVINALHNYVDGYGRVRRLLDTLLLKRASFFVAVSDRVALSHNRVYNGLAADKVRVIEDGIKLPVGEAVLGVSRKALKIPADAFVVGTVGRFEPEKNQMLLLQAFSLFRSVCPQAVLVLVGHGSLESHLRQQAGCLGLEEQVFFVVGQKADPYYELFDCFVVSSPSEGLCLALLEAMVRSIPCVVMNKEASHPALVNGCNGLLVASYNASSLARALQQLLQNPVAMSSMGCAGRETVLERYTVDRMASAYRDLFKSCIQANGCRSSR